MKGQEGIGRSKEDIVTPLHSIRGREELEACSYLCSLPNKNDPFLMLEHINVNTVTPWSLQSNDHSFVERERERGKCILLKLSN